MVNGTFLVICFSCVLQNLNTLICRITTKYLTATIFLCSSTGVSRYHYDYFRTVKDKIHTAIAGAFGISKDSLYLTSPTFFSRMTSKPARTIHDEYWHIHVDKVCDVVWYWYWVVKMFLFLYCIMSIIDDSRQFIVLVILLDVVELDVCVNF